VSEAGTTSASVPSRRPVDVRRLVRRHGWTAGVYLLLLVLVMYWRSTTALPWGPFDVQSVAIDALPLAFAACGQSIAIISGGIDLSIGSMMSLVNVVAARWMLHLSFREALLYSLLIVLAGALAGTLTGLLIVVTRVADIIVTLAMLFVWAGAALAVMTIPGGGVPLRFGALVTADTIGTKWFPSALLILGVAVAIVWLPIRRSRAGLTLYAVGSKRNAAYLAGVNVAAARVGAYALSGTFAALGGVSLLGGVGGLVGPIAAAFVLTLVKTILIIKGVDQNWAQVAQGALVVLVMMIGGLALRQKGKAGS
jgi:ribose transport system permease protein